MLARPVARYLAAAAAVIVAWAPPPPSPAPPAFQRVTARFSPRGGCAELVAWNVDAARSTVLVGSYQWSNRLVHDALLRARARGVRVRVILDPAVEHAALTGELIKAGMTAGELRVDDRHAIFHLKVVLRDAETPGTAAVGTGSFNFSAQSDTRNAENAVVLEGFPEVTAAFAVDMEKHWSHSRPVRPEPVRPIKTR